MSADTPQKARARVQLDRESIVDAGIALASREHPAPLTFRKLGDELGADPTAIYRHFRDKDELMRALADRLYGLALSRMEDTADWRARLMSFARAITEVGDRYPSIASALGSRTTRGEHEFKAIEVVLGSLRQAGLDAKQAAVYYAAITVCVVSSVSARAQYFLLDRQIREADDAAWTGMYALADPIKYPAIAESGPLVLSVTDEEVLRYTLGAILDSVARDGAANATPRRASANRATTAR